MILIPPAQLAECQVAVCFSTADLTAEQAEALGTAFGKPT